MKPGIVSFDPLARFYRALEFLAFGGDLERARFCLLDRLADRRSILILGEGDGRALARLVQLAPSAKIHCIDSSAAMLTRAQARLAGSTALDRVTFECADALNCEFPVARYDAVVTLFFLDCFDAMQAADVVRRVNTALQPDAVWLFADFVLPPRGLARWRARRWLGVLYAFFRWQTGLRTHELPPSEDLILAAGFRCEAARDFQWGLLRSAFFIRSASAKKAIWFEPEARKLATSPIPGFLASGFKNPIFLLPTAASTAASARGRRVR